MYSGQTQMLACFCWCDLYS